jgi:hypothetical protein
MHVAVKRSKTLLSNSKCHDEKLTVKCTQDRKFTAGFSYDRKIMEYTNDEYCLMHWY